MEMGKKRTGFSQSTTFLLCPSEEVCNVPLYQSGFGHNFPKNSKASTFAGTEYVAEKIWPFTDIYLEKCLDMTDVNVYQPYNQPF